MRCQGFGDAARREEGEYPQRSSTDEQRGGSPKDWQPFGLASGELLAALLLGHRAKCGYAPSSRLATSPPEASAPIPNL
ncbi:MAG TPA: hypothetical protein VH595_01280 [Verrucomicrobiae bacterium]|nr:hypothetical protein [Verrucomicrobiae bacterium]